MAIATHLINRTPSKVLNLSTSIDILSLEYPQLSLMTNLPAKIFGCVVYARVHNVGKLDHRSLKCIFLGYSPTKKGYKCYHPMSRKLLITADARFDEQSMFYDRTEGQLDTFLPDLNHGEGSDEDHYRLTSDVREHNPNANSISRKIEEENAIIPEIEQVEEDSPSGTDMPSNHGWPIAISKGVRKYTKNKLYPIGNFVSHNIISPEYNRIIQELMTVSILKNVREDMASAEWKQAMNEEMEALKKNDTWEMGPLPIGKKVVGSRWVFTIKYHSDGSIAQYKARLVAEGYTQSYGIDYVETSASVAKLNTIRVLIAIAATYQWELYQYDVKNVFLHGELEEEVYMSPPPGYVLSNNPSDVCHLKKSLYGLKQSPRAWFGKFSKTMLSAGYFQSEGDYTLFIKTVVTGR